MYPYFHFLLHLWSNSFQEFAKVILILLKVVQSSIKTSHSVLFHISHSITHIMLLDPPSRNPATRSPTPHRILDSEDPSPVKYLIQTDEVVMTFSCFTFEYDYQERFRVAWDFLTSPNFFKCCFVKNLGVMSGLRYPRGPYKKLKWGSLVSNQLQIGAVLLTDLRLGKHYHLWILIAFSA